MSSRFFSLVFTYKSNRGLYSFVYTELQLLNYFYGIIQSKRTLLQTKKNREKNSHKRTQRRSKTSEIGKNVDFGKRWNHFIFLNCSQIVNYILRFVIESDMVASNNHTKRTFLFILSVVLCYFILHNEKKKSRKIRGWFFDINADELSSNAFSTRQKKIKNRKNLWRQV